MGNAGPKRKAFTLIELVIVIGIIMALMSIVGIVVWTSQQGENVPRAANIIQGAFVQAKNRAALDRQRNGVRIVPAGNNTSVELIYIQDPGPYSEGHVIAQGNVVDCNFSFEGLVQGNDQIEFNGHGQVYLIKGIDPTNPKRLILEASLPPGVVIGPTNTFREVNPNDPASDIKQPNYKIYRQPRPIPGMEPIKLPENAVIKGGFAGANGQLEGSAYDASPLKLDQPVNIIFGEKGRVVGDAAAANVIYLWVGDTDPSRPENNYLVVIYTRTGSISTYPVSGSSDKYFNARSGRAQGGL